MSRTEELILLYHFTNTEKERKIKDALKRMKIKSRDIPDEMMMQKVGYLAGLHGFKETASDETIEPFDQEVMLMQGIGSKRMNELLLNFKAGGIEPISLKAVVTPYNVFWTFSRLCQTIQKENQFMERK